MRVRPRSAPPAAGPSTCALCHPPVFHATALWYASIGTISGSSAGLAGLITARAVPLRQRHPYMRGTDAWRTDTTASPIAASTRTVCAVMSTRRHDGGQAPLVAGPQGAPDLAPR